jgi:cobalt/nickel transport protein
LKKKNLLLIVICIVLIAIPLIVCTNSNFGGADDEIQSKVVEVDSNYKPWAHYIWKPQSAEVESFLFALQAAIGAGFIGYYIGRKSNVQNNNSIFKDK